MRIQIYDAFCRKEFKVSFFVVYIITMVSFVMECIPYYGSELNLCRGSNEVNIITGLYGGINILILIMPLLSCIIYSGSYADEKKSGVYRFIICRKHVASYLFQKALVIFIVNMLVFILPMMINFLLCRLFFPSFNYENTYGLAQYDVAGYDSQLYMDMLRIQDEFLYSVNYAINISIFSGLIGLLSFGILLCTDKEKYKVFVGVYVCYIMYEFVLGTINRSDFALMAYCRPMMVGNHTNEIILKMGLLTVSILLIIIGIIKERKNMEF